MYASIAESDYSDLKKVEFHFDDPEAGWVNMTIKFDGKVVAELQLSGVWGSDPVGDLMKWMEDCIESPAVPHYLYPSPLRRLSGGRQDAIGRGR